MKDYQKPRETKNSRHKKKNTKTERIPKQGKWTLGHFSKFREAIGENQWKENSAENLVPSQGSKIIKAHMLTNSLEYQTNPAKP